MFKTTIIDFVATRLPDDAESYPDWTIRCTWVCTEGEEEVSHTFHGCTHERAARGLARFVLDRYSEIDARMLVSAELLRPDGTWESVPRPNTTVTAPVVFAFQRLPERPKGLGSQVRRS